MTSKKLTHSVSMLLAVVGASSLGGTPVQAQAPRPAKSSVELASVTPPAGVGAAVTNTSVGWHARQGTYYKRNWGVDIVDVRRVASGEMLALRYVVLDPEKAKVLNDKRNTAYLIDEKSGNKLMVPQMEKIGALRTTVTPKAGRMYWMVFANTGGAVDVGSRVDVVIGDFQAHGLTVDSKQ